MFRLFPSDGGTKAIRIGAPLLLFVLSPLLIAMQVYYYNTAEFSVPLSQLLSYLVPFLAVLFVVLFLPLLALKGRPHKYSVALVFSLAFMFWLQGSILNWDYGVLTGARIDWSEYGHRLAIDVLAWAAVIILCLRFAAILLKNVVFASFLLFGIQAAAVYFSYVGSAGTPSFHHYTIVDEGKMDFSDDQNVVVILLDGFQSDVFQEIIDDKPDYRDVFSGFTFFRNTTSQYSKTYGAVPALLTGRWYENRVPVQRFLDKSFRESISTKLLAQGWDAQLYPAIPRTIGYSEAFASNIRLKVDDSDKAAEAGRLMDIGFFRGSPQFLKPYWLNGFEWRLSRSLAKLAETGVGDLAGSPEREGVDHAILEFVDNSQRLMSPDLDRPAFKFYHFLVPHEPFVLNEQLEYERLPSGREGFRRYSMAGLESVRRFIDELKRKNLYDNTMLFIVSDHGGGEYRAGILDHPEVGLDQGDIYPRHHQSGLALLLAKPFGAQEPLEISDAPASVGDVLPSITAALDMEKSYPGKDLFSLSGENIERERRYLFYDFDGWEHEYLPIMVEYRIRGHAWHASSWQPTGRTYSPGDRQSAGQQETLDAVELGENYWLNMPGAVDVLGSGWSGTEAHGVWSTARVATITIPVAPDAVGPMQVSLRLRPNMCGETIPFQRVLVNNSSEGRVASLEVASGDWYSFRVSHEDFHQNQLVLRLRLPDAQSPKSCETGRDARRLGVLISAFRVGGEPAQ